MSEDQRFVMLQFVWTVSALHGNLSTRCFGFEKRKEKIKYVYSVAEEMDLVREKCHGH